MTTTGNRDGFWLRIIYIVSALVSAAVAFLILGPRPAGARAGLDVSMLPTVNASLNALTAALLSLKRADSNVNLRWVLRRDSLRELLRRIVPKRRLPNFDLAR